MTTRHQLHDLVEINRVIVGELKLPVVLREIVSGAVRLVGARYGALGVATPDGTALEQFITVGIPDGEAELIGPRPTGHGLLGAVMQEAKPIRLTSMSDDSRSAGFPGHHPPMRSFLGVPIYIRDQIFGNLYLTDAEAGEFTVEDEELVVSLAATAAIAIENARLYAQARQRERWLQASLEVTRELVSPTDVDVLEQIAEHTRRIADADIVSVVLPLHDGTHVMVEAAAGVNADEYTGVSVDLDSTLTGDVIRTGERVILTDVKQHPRYRVEDPPVRASGGPTMVLPLGAADAVRGALIVARDPGRPPFDEITADLATTFANHAAAALELADARARDREIAVLQDRLRIGHDLHDTVIQRLYAAGLSVQKAAAALGDGPLRRTLTAAVHEVDATIDQVRETVFDLRGGTNVRRS